MCPREAAQVALLSLGSANVSTSNASSPVRPLLAESQENQQCPPLYPALASSMPYYSVGPAALPSFAYKSASTKLQAPRKKGLGDTFRGPHYLAQEMLDMD